MNLSAALDNATLQALASPITTLVVPVIYMGVFVISTPCNIIALFLLHGLTKRTTPAVIYSINLCLADLLYSISLPLQVDYHLRRNNWRFGPVACGISTVVYYCNAYCSILTTCAIALERYLGIVRPLKSRHQQSTRKAFVTCLLIWALVLVFQLPYFLFNFTRYVPQLNITTCFDVFPREPFTGLKGYLYFISSYLLFYLTPLVVLITCYCMVARSLRHMQSPDIHGSHKRTQTLVMVTALCFVVCYLPNMIIQPAHMVFRSKERSLYAYYKLSLGLNSLNCCFDPFVYYLASSDLRNALWRLLRRLRFCCSYEEEEPGASNLSELASVARGHQNDSTG